MSIPRNRWLLIALGLVVLFFAGDAGYRKFYEEPAQDRERSKEQLSKRLSDCQSRIGQVERRE